jgi:hypothetical protein
MEHLKMKDIFNKLHERKGGAPPITEGVEDEDRKEIKTWLTENADDELEELLEDLGMTMGDMESHLMEIKVKGKRKKAKAGPKGGPKGDSKPIGVRFTGKVPGTGGKFNMDKCIKSKVADKKFKVKNKKKYPSKEAAARALCSWIISRSKKSGTQSKMRGSRGPGRGYSGKAFKGWAPGSGKGGKKLKFSPAQLRAMKKKKTASTEEPDAATVVVEKVMEIAKEDTVEEILTALDLFFEQEITYEELQAYVIPRLEEEDSWKGLDDILQDIEGVEEDDLDPDQYAEGDDPPEEGEEGEAEGEEGESEEGEEAEGEEGEETEG